MNRGVLLRCGLSLWCYASEKRTGTCPWWWCIVERLASEVALEDLQGDFLRRLSSGGLFGSVKGYGHEV